ncbi:methyl-accepting chemotaxis protein [Paraburkholderia adhaesiva]|uniref:methyl-accepting chemotaxis protein n=1 Tax=Paraburkholderia adhaesiva TaxID=2883244 RepID=UPI001F195E6D|nr:methyl-accepting chemotaxis protein [Paraburkholderia adhaesiva]
MFKKLTVLQKLLGTFGIVAVVGAASGGAGIMALSRMYSITDEIAQHHMRGVALLGDISRSKLSADLDGANFGYMHDDEGKQRVAADTHEKIAATEDFIRQYSAISGETPEGQALLDELQRTEKAWGPLIAQAVALIPHEAQYVGRDDLLVKDAIATSAKMMAEITALTEYRKTRAIAATKEAADLHETMFVVQMLFVLAGFVASLAFGFFIARELQRQLGGEPHEAQELARKIAAGDLTSRVSLRRSDKTSVMAGLADMQSHLREIIGSIQVASDAILIASNQIARGNLDLSQRTEEQAASLEQTAASMDELTTTVNANNAFAGDALRLVDQSSQSAAQSGTAMEELSGSMQSLVGHASKITEIIATIEGIAFQTNILALNAAVEAARAGEQGKGFAVVAGEVRTLAQRAAAAAKEIKELIDTTTRDIRSGSEITRKTSESLVTVQQAVEQVAGLMRELTDASDHQSTGITQVNQAVRQMDSVTQQNAALVEEAAAAAQSMSEQAGALRQSVAVFRLS